MAVRKEEGQVVSESDIDEKYVNLEVVGGFKKRVIEKMFAGHVEEAVNELKSNIDAERDRLNGGTVVLISVGDDKLRVVGYRESGMGEAGLKRFFKIGESTEQGVGAKGSGAKLAAIGVAYNFEVKAKLPGESEHHVVEIPNLGDDKVSLTGKWPIKSDTRLEPGQAEIGIVDTTLTGMKWERPISFAQLRESIIATYGSILEPIERKFNYRMLPKDPTPRHVVNAAGEVETVTDRVTVYVYTSKDRKTRQIVPPEVPIKEGSSSGLQVVRTDMGEPVGVEVAILDRSNPAVRKTKAGGEFVLDGQVIHRGEFFDIPQARDTRVSSGLRGIVQVDHVAGIKDDLQMNKSAGFLRKGPAFNRVVEVVRPIFERKAEEIISQEPLEAPRISNRLKEQLQLGRRFADSALRQLMEDGLIGDITGGEKSRVEVTGQIPPVKGGEGRPAKRPVGIEGTPWADQQGRTMRHHDADPNVPRKRVSPYKIEFGPIESDERSRVEIGPDTKPVLKINSEHPLNQLPLMVAAVYPEAGILVPALSAELQILNIAQELSEGDPAVLRLIQEQALGVVGRILASEPAFQSLQRRVEAGETEKAEKKPARGRGRK